MRIDDFSKTGELKDKKYALKTFALAGFKQKKSIISRVL